MIYKKLRNITLNCDFRKGIVALFVYCGRGVHGQFPPTNCNANNTVDFIAVLGRILAAVEKFGFPLINKVCCYVIIEIFLLTQALNIFHDKHSFLRCR